MWREDHLYDLVLDIGWNRGPIIKGRGSAIFLHFARPGFAPTEGCVAVEPRMAARLLSRIGPHTMIEIVG
jgi:L,D-peptidoglycan transpeptidase YkuD (ErfK/YbiS/YcfS/YnhG family)